MEQSSDRNNRLDKLGDAQLVAELVRRQLDDPDEMPGPEHHEFAELVRRGFSAKDIRLESAHLLGIVRGESMPRRPATRFGMLRSISNIKKFARSLAVVAALLFALLFSGAANDSADGATYIGGTAIIAMLAAFVAWARLTPARLKLARHEAAAADTEES